MRQAQKHARSGLQLTKLCVKPGTPAEFEVIFNSCRPKRLLTCRLEVGLAQLIVVTAVEGVKTAWRRMAAPALHDPPTAVHH